MISLDGKQEHTPSGMRKERSKGQKSKQKDRRVARSTLDWKETNLEEMDVPELS